MTTTSTATATTRHDLAAEIDPALFAPPPFAQRARELLAVREPARLALGAPRLAATPRGTSRPLLTLPGLGATDTSMAPIRRYLASRDHDARGWGLGRNDGDVESLIERATAVAADIAERAGRPINLLGWSVGGVLAREIARDRADIVHRVATYGTPLTGPRHTAAVAAYSDEQLDQVDALIREREDRPITPPVLAIYSRNDGIVDWRTCIDRRSPHVTHRRASSTHLAMGVDPDVWRWTAEWFADEAEAAGHRPLSRRP